LRSSKSDKENESSASLPAEQTCERVRAAHNKVVTAAKKYLLEPEEEGQELDGEVEEDMAAPPRDLEVSQEAPMLPDPELAYGRSPGEVVKHMITTHTGENALSLSRCSKENPPGLLAQPPGLPPDGSVDDEDYDKATMLEGQPSAEDGLKHGKESVKAAMFGDWRNHEGKNYAITFTDDIPSVETGDEHGEQLRIQLCPDKSLNYFWWGSHHFMDIDDLIRKPHQICWYDAADKYKQPRRVSFAWKRPHMQPSALLQYIDGNDNSSTDEQRLKVADQVWKEAIPYLTSRKSKLPLWTGSDSAKNPFADKHELVASLELGHDLHMKTFEDDTYDEDTAYAGSTAEHVQGAASAAKENAYSGTSSYTREEYAKPGQYAEEYAKPGQYGTEEYTEFGQYDEQYREEYTEQDYTGQEYAEPGSSSSDTHGHWGEAHSSSYAWYSSDRNSKRSSNDSRSKRKQEEVWNCLKGIWLGHKNETYELRLQNGFEPATATWGCTRHNHKGSKLFKLVWDEQHWLIWWGSSFWLDAQELLKNRGFATWYITHGDGTNKVCFKWTRSEPTGANNSEWSDTTSCQVAQPGVRWQARKEKNKRALDSEATVFD